MGVGVCGNDPHCKCHSMSSTELAEVSPVILMITEEAVIISQWLIQTHP